MVIDKKVHREFLLMAIQSIQFNGNLEQITQFAEIGTEVLKAVENAKVTEK